MSEQRDKRKRRGERPNGTIQVSAQIGFRPDGKPNRKYFYGRTRAEAEKKKAEFLKEYNRSQTARNAFNKDITVAEWVDIYKKTYRTNVNPLYHNVDDVPYNRLVSSIGRIRIVDIREAHLQAALADVAGMSESTCKKYYYAIKRVFKRAKKNKLIADDPAEDLVLPKCTSGTHRALEEWEIDLILKYWNHPGVRGGLMILIMLLCGLRRGEAMALEWKHIDLEKRELHVEQVAVIEVNKAVIEDRAKTDSGLRIIPIPQILFDALSSVPKEKRNGFVCLNAHGEQLSESSYNRTMESFLRGVTRLANGEKPNQSGYRRCARLVPGTTAPQERIILSFTAHDLRHTYATALYDAGVPVKAAQYFLGHADLKITLELYTHLSKERVQSSRNLAVEYLDKWVSKRLVSKSDDDLM